MNACFVLYTTYLTFLLKCLWNFLQKNGGLECPAAASHHGSVVGRMNDYCIAANVLSAGSLLTLDECSGLQSVFDTCKSNGSCPACNGENPLPPSPSPPSGTYNYCGSSWADANTQCNVPCPNGQGDCTSGTCYADATNCPVNSPLRINYHESLTVM